jgi:hypothetical protein
MAVEIDQAVPFPDAADQASRPGRRRCARPGRPADTPGTSYRLAVLRHDQVARLIRHPKLRQRSRLLPAHHGVTPRPSADW